MKLNKQWKSLTRDQKQAWVTWAKNNPVLLEDGNLRRVSGHKAFTVIVNQRALAGETANPTVVPATAAWLNGALSLRDAGPFTVNAGYVGFRVEQNLGPGTKWFVWATPPLGAGENEPHRRLRFLKCMTLGALNLDDLVPDLGPDYLSVCGSWDGPGEDGEWPVDTFIWFRLHHYGNGQLGPGVMMKARIQLEL